MTLDVYGSALALYEREGDFEPLRKALRPVETRSRNVIMPDNAGLNGQLLSAYLHQAEQVRSFVYINTIFKLLDILPFDPSEKSMLADKASAILKGMDIA